MAADEEMVVRRYSVTGRVQGVGFRWWARKTAEEMGVSGTVANRRDGSVTVVAAGTPATLARFEDELRRGPRLARVDNLETVELRDTMVPPGFDIDTEWRI